MDRKLRNAHLRRRSDRSTSATNGEHDTGKVSGANGTVTNALNSATKSNQSSSESKGHAAGRRGRTAITAKPETTAASARNKIPPTNECVRSLRKPMTYGPANPPRLPSELMNAIAPAAATPVKRP